MPRYNFAPPRPDYPAASVAHLSSAALTTLDPTVATPVRCYRVHLVIRGLGLEIRLMGKDRPRARVRADLKSDDVVKDRFELAPLDLRQPKLTPPCSRYHCWCSGKLRNLFAAEGRHRAQDLAVEPVDRITVKPSTDVPNTTKRYQLTFGQREKHHVTPISERLTLSGTKAA